MIRRREPGKDARSRKPRRPHGECNHLRRGPAWLEGLGVGAVVFVAVEVKKWLDARRRKAQPA